MVDQIIEKHLNGEESTIQLECTAEHVGSDCLAAMSRGQYLTLKGFWSRLRAQRESKNYSQQGNYTGTGEGVYCLSKHQKCENR
jgi:hypothetical protein